MENLKMLNQKDGKFSQDQSFKFVQFQKEENVFLRFIGEYSYHNQIVARFIEEMRIKEVHEKRDSSGMISPFFQENCPYKLVGAGLCTINQKEKTILIDKDDYSSSYDIYPNKDHIKKMASKYPDWKFSII